MKHQLGLTLLEVSIALSIGGVILLLGIKSVEYLNRYNSTNEVKSEVALLKLALEEYYFSNCSQNPFSQPTTANLKQDKYLPAQFNADNGIGAPYTVSINNAATPPSYSISLTLNNGLDPNIYRQRLAVTNTNGQNLFWTYPLSITRQYNDRSLGHFKRFYGNKSC